MERHPEVVGQGPARLGCGGTRRGTARAAMDSRQVSFPGWMVQDGDQQHEPVVNGVTVPDGLNCGHPAWKCRGTNHKRGDVERIRPAVLHTIAKGLVASVDDLLCLTQAQPQRAYGIPYGLP